MDSIPLGRGKVPAEGVFLGMDCLSLPRWGGTLLLPTKILEQVQNLRMVVVMARIGKPRWFVEDFSHVDQQQRWMFDD